MISPNRPTRRNTNEIFMDNDKNPARSRQPSQDEGSRLLGEPAENGFCLRVKLKVSLCLGTTAVLSFMVFLFLVPFVVDPAVSRLIARYSSEPGTCALHEHVFAAGMSKCTWSSCREGCTSATTRCHQITVNYSLTPYEQYYQARTRSTRIVEPAKPCFRKARSIVSEIILSSTAMIES